MKRGGIAMATDTPAGASQRRELAEPSERTQPIPLVVAAVTLVMVLLGAVYILMSEPPGEARYGDRRTLAELRGDGKPAGAVDGAQVFAANCVACHQATGKGLPGVFPPLDGSEWVNGDERVLANILLHGVEGEMRVAGATYKSSMPGFKQLGDAELAAVASHVRSHWSNLSPAVKPELFAQERRAHARDKPYAGEAELKTLAASTP
jgi:mono/diheme cytochrome c family protein